jgi:hypothetical protein
MFNLIPAAAHRAMRQSRTAFSHKIRAATTETELSAVLDPICLRRESRNDLQRRFRPKCPKREFNIHK